MPAIFTFPNRILFDEGAVASLPSEMTRLGVARPLIVTDPGLIKAGLAGHIAELCADPVIFSDVHANPTEDDVRRGLDLYLDRGRDGLIALGGGSPIDAAKAIRLLAGHGGRLDDYDLNRGGLEMITASMPPMVAIPTTAGTGSEAGRGALIQMAASGRKVIVLSPFLLPSVAICDPELTYGLPREITAGTGMDAFTHAIESYLSTTFHPICDGIALESLRHISRGLEASVLDGSDRRARRSMMLGALMAGIAFHKGLGVVHSLSHALGGRGRAHHGTLNAILLPHALRFDRQAAGDRMSDIASALGLGRSGDGPSHLATLSELLLTRLPLPRRLGDVPGLEREMIPVYADLAMLDHCHRTNPRPCSRLDMEDLLDAAW